MKKFYKYLLIFNFIFIFCLFIFFSCAKYIPLDFTSKQEKITIYDINDNLIFESNFNKNIQWYELEEYPELVIDLVLTIEDQRFYDHLGVDPLRVIKALINNIRANKVVEGGSTITQQMAKNLFLSNEQTLSRKFNELFIASQMELQYSKEDILESYLNTLYFGHGIYGFHEASHFFFNTELEDCSIAQITMMIGIINGPSIYSPYIDYEASIDKTYTLLTYLNDSGYLSDEEYQISINENIILTEEKYEKSDSSYYTQAVLDEIHYKNIDTSKGITIHTSYDPNVQKVLSSSILKNASSDECETSGIILDPNNGNVLAISGGKNPSTSEYIRPLYSKRQIGSTIKPLLYYKALENGFTPSTSFMSSPTNFQIDDVTVYSPINYAEKYPYRDISMINAIAVSDNIYAMKTHLFLGMDTLVDALAMFDVQADPLPSLALGTSEMTLLQLTSIYNTFASMGIYHEPSFIQSIYQENQIIYKNNYEYEEYFDKDTTIVLNQMLTSTFDIKNKTVTMPTLYNMSLNTKVAAKSGTSDFDSLIVGYNPDYTIGIWSGFDDGRILNEEYFQISKNVFKDTFNSLYNEDTYTWYPLTDNLESKIVDPISGQEALLGSEYWYIK